MRITVLGAGTWGMALAKILAENGHSLCVWSAIPEEIKEISETRRHKNLPEMKIPEAVSFTDDLSFSVSGGGFSPELVIFAVPSLYIRSVAEKCKGLLPAGAILVSVAKGMEQGTFYTMSEILEDVLSETFPVVALSGPTHAEEVAKNLPTLIVSSSKDETAAEQVQGIFRGTCIRAYTNPDIKGVELCGALKNVIALASGIATGIGYGDNTRAALITRGMREISRIGLSMGCLSETFNGLAGIGDLIVTATSGHSRNNRCGIYLGQGLKADEAVAKVGMVVEGLNALPAVRALSRERHVETPICDAVYDVVEGIRTPEEAVVKLFQRSMKSEVMG